MKCAPKPTQWTKLYPGGPNWGPLGGVQGTFWARSGHAGGHFGSFRDVRSQGISQTDFNRYMSNNCGEIFGYITLGLNGLS